MNEMKSAKVSSLNRYLHFSSVAFATVVKCIHIEILCEKPSE